MTDSDRLRPDMKILKALAKTSNDPQKTHKKFWPEISITVEISTPYLPLAIIKYQIE